MKKTSIFAISAIASLGVACAQSLYFVGDEAQDSIPLKWSVGMNAIWDNNVTPGTPAGSLGHEDEAFSLNPYVGVNMTSISAQSTLDIYARAGVIYYLDQPEANGSDDVYGNGRLGLDFTHRYSERLRFSSRNFIAYELEPEYSYGIASVRSIDPYTYWSTDNSIGYRWTERLATYSGFNFLGYDSGDGSNRDSITLYHSFRYQVSQRSVLTAEYRASQWGGGNASDSYNHIISAGLEHRFNPTSVAIIKAGAQIRSVDGGVDSNSPYLEAAISTQVNSRLSFRGFTRYGIEDYNTVQLIGGVPFEYNDQRVWRTGLTGEYALSPKLSIFGGLDYISTNYGEGIEQNNGALTTPDYSDELINLYLGARVKFTDTLTGEATVNWTDSASDLGGSREYDRIRLSAGVNYSF